MSARTYAYAHVVQYVRRRSKIRRAMRELYEATTVRDYCSEARGECIRGCIANSTRGFLASASARVRVRVCTSSRRAGGGGD